MYGIEATISLHYLAEQAATCEGLPNHQNELRQTFAVQSKLDITKDDFTNFTT